MMKVIPRYKLNIGEKREDKEVRVRFGRERVRFSLEMFVGGRVILGMAILRIAHES